MLQSEAHSACPPHLRRILVVDDEPGMLSVLERFVTELG